MSQNKSNAYRRQNIASKTQLPEQPGYIWSIDTHDGFGYS